MMGTTHVTEVKQQWAILALAWVTVGVVGQVWSVFDSQFVFFHQIFISSSTLLVCLKAFAAHACRLKDFSALF